MANDKTARRPKAETPKGFRDYFGAEVTERKAMLDAIAEVYHRYGFEALETSAVETVEALGKFLPDVDRPNEGVFGWQDEDKDWLALRYDLTAPLARVAAQFRNDLPSPYRRYAMGPVWRNEKPGPGRFRQFYQCDADTVGAPSVAADAEICAMLSDALETVGIPRGDYVIRVNNRKVLNGVMEVAGVLDPADPSKFEAERGIVLRAIDKIDRLGEEGVRALLGAGRKDESGDFTKGAGLSEAQAEVVMGFVVANEKVTQILANEQDIAFGLGEEKLTRELGYAAGIGIPGIATKEKGNVPEGKQAAVRPFARQRHGVIQHGQSALDHQARRGHLGQRAVDPTILRRPARGQLAPQCLPCRPIARAGVREHAPGAFLQDGRRAIHQQHLAAFLLQRHRGRERGVAAAENDNIVNAGEDRFKRMIDLTHGAMMVQSQSVDRNRPVKVLRMYGHADRHDPPGRQDRNKDRNKAGRSAPRGRRPIQWSA